MSQTIFQNPFPVPHPFTVERDPGNIINIPAFVSLAYQSGPSPSVAPPQGLPAPTFRDVFGGIFPSRNK